MGIVPPSLNRLMAEDAVPPPGRSLVGLIGVGWRLHVLGKEMVGIYSLVVS